MTLDPKPNCLCDLCHEKCEGLVDTADIRSEMLKQVNMHPASTPYMNSLGRALFDDWKEILPTRTCGYQSSVLQCTNKNSSFCGDECPLKHGACAWKKKLPE